MDGAAFGDDITRLVNARKELEEAVQGVLEMAAGIPDLTVCGSDELPAALSALQAAEYVDSEEDAARWVSRAFTLTPLTARSVGGEPVLALTGAVMMLRGALHSLDDAKNQG